VARRGAGRYERSSRQAADVYVRRLSGSAELRQHDTPMVLTEASCPRCRGAARGVAARDLGGPRVRAVEGSAGVMRTARTTVPESERCGAAAGRSSLWAHEEGNRR